MPIGYLVTTTLVALCTLVALAPPRPRRTSLSNRSFWFAFLINEQPIVAFYWLLASTLLAIGQGDIGSPVGWTGLGLAVLATIGLVVIAWRTRTAIPAIENAMSEGLGADWGAAIDAERPTQLGRHLPIARILFMPFLARRSDVKRVRNISYGDSGRRNLLDVYHHRSRPSGGPVLVYLHGGAFRIGNKTLGARPLLYRLASRGWVCISANYRLAPAARFPDYLVDVKKVIAWVREHGHEYGANPTVVFIAGSSAGGHLASTAALTTNDPAFQPGFEGADTSVTAAISLYGYYGSTDTYDRTPSSPLDYLGAGAPPFFVAHGENDTLVVVDDARAFVEQLRSTSSNSVVYVELPDAQHAFDFFHSVRFDSLVDAIEAFAAWVLNPRGAARVEPSLRPAPGPEPPSQ